MPTHKRHANATKRMKCVLVPIFFFITSSLQSPVLKSSLSLFFLKKRGENRMSKAKIRNEPEMGRVKKIPNPPSESIKERRKAFSIIGQRTRARINGAVAE